MTDLLPVWPHSGVHGGAVVCNGPSGDTKQETDTISNIMVNIMDICVV